MEGKTKELGLSKKLWYGVGYLPDSILNNVYAWLVFVIYDGELMLGAAAIGLVGMLIRLWDAFNDPFIGNLSDKTRTRWGRRHPYMVAGVILGALCTLLLWNPPTGLGPNALWWYLLVSAFLYYTAFSIYSVPYFALGLGMSTSEKDRDGLMGWRVAANSVVLCLVPATPMLVYNGWLGDTPMESLTRLSFILAGLIVVTGLAAARFLPQPVLEPEPAAPQSLGLIDGIRCVYRNKPFLAATGIVSLALFGLVVGSAMLFYINLAVVYPIGDLADRKADATRMMGVTGFAGAFLALILSPFVASISNRIGRKRLLTFAIGSMIAAYLLSPWLFTAAQPWLQLGFHLLFFFGITFVFVLTAPMIGEVCDIDELETGLRREGIFSAMFNLGFKVSIALAMMAGGLMVSLSGFTMDLAEQDPATLLKLRGGFLLLPLISFAGCLYLNRIYPLNGEMINRMRREKGKIQIS